MKMHLANWYFWLFRRYHFTIFCIGAFGNNVRYHRTKLNVYQETMGALAGLPQYLY